MLTKRCTTDTNKLKVMEFSKVIFLLCCLYHIPYLSAFIVYQYYDENKVGTNSYGLLILMIFVYIVTVILRFIVTFIVILVARNSEKSIVKYMKSKNLYLLIGLGIFDYCLYKFLIPFDSVYAFFSYNFATFILFNSLFIVYLPFFLVYGILDLISIIKRK